MTSRARYIIEKVSIDKMVISDVGDHTKCLTVTNDAERVVTELNASGRLGDRRLYYYDSDGQLDELKHDGAGHFVGYRPGPQ